MRTVSFSSDNVRKLMNKEFHCATINTDGDPTAGSSSAHAPTDSCGRCARGLGKQNVQCLFVTSRGEIFHVASGYVGPKDLERELRFAIRLYKAIQDTPDDAKKVVAQAHRQRLKEFGFTKADLKSPRSRSSTRDLANDILARRRELSARRRLTPAQLRQLAGQMRARMRTIKRRNSVGLNNFANDGDDFHLSRSSGIFSFKSKRAVLNDHKFCIEQPLYSYDEFERRPQILVGNEKTAFSSTGAGGPSGGRIGN